MIRNELIIFMDVCRYSNWFFNAFLIMYNVCSKIYKIVLENRYFKLLRHHLDKPNGISNSNNVVQFIEGLSVKIYLLISKIKSSTMTCAISDKSQPRSMVELDIAISTTSE